MPDRGRPSQIAPGAAQHPAELRARPDVRPAPSRPVCARSRAPWICPRVTVIPAECTAPLTMPLQGVLSGFIVRHTSDRVNVFPRVLRSSGVPCAAARVLPSRRLYRHPPRNVPAAPKGPARRRATFWPRFRAGFYSVFTRILSDLRSAYACLIVAGIVARHSRLIVA